MSCGLLRNEPCMRTAAIMHSKKTTCQLRTTRWWLRLFCRFFCFDDQYILLHLHLWCIGLYCLWCFYCHFAVLFSSNSFTCSSSHLLRDLCRTLVWWWWWQSVETYGTVCPQSAPFHPLPHVIVEWLVSRASCLFQQDPVLKIPHVPFCWDMTCWFVCVYDGGGNGSDHTQIAMWLWSSLEFKYRD